MVECFASLLSPSAVVQIGNTYHGNEADILEMVAEGTGLQSLMAQPLVSEFTV